MNSREDTTLALQLGSAVLTWDIAQRPGLGPEAHTGCHKNVPGYTSGGFYSWINLLFRLNI